MTKEFLEKLGITGENADAIIKQAETETNETVNKSMAKYGDYDDIKKQLKAANDKIEEFGKLDYDGIKALADDYKAKYEQSEKDAAAKLEKMQFDHLLDSKIGEIKPKNAKAVKALLDMDGLKLNNGEIVGLKDQLDKIVKENDYLFETNEPMPQFSGSTKGGSGSTDNDVRAIMGLAPIK